MSSRHKFIEVFAVLGAALLCSCLASSDSDDAEVTASVASALVSVGVSVGGGGGDDFVCPQPDGTFYHEECTKFWHCSNNIPYEKDCPAGLHFVERPWPLEGYCEWPELANCEG
jgi:hypothetical protein